MNLIRDRSGSILIESILILVAIVTPVLFAATAIAELLDARAKLESTSWRAARSFNIAPTNSAGFTAITKLENDQQQFFSNPLKITVICNPKCESGELIEVKASTKVTISRIPLLADLNLNWQSTRKMLLDRYLER